MFSIIGMLDEIVFVTLMVTVDALFAHLIHYISIDYTRSMMYFRLCVLTHSIKTLCCPAGYQLISILNTYKALLKNYRSVE